MRYNFFYGTTPRLTEKDAEMFSRGDYQCQRLLQTRGGSPVIVLRNTVSDIWMVQNGFSSVYFGDYSEAMAYCRTRFCELDGGPIRK